MGKNQQSHSGRAEGGDKGESAEGRGLRIASRTHVGLRRESNQDFLAIRDLGGRGFLLVVADGMGGHRGGERASRLAVETFVDAVEGMNASADEVLVSALAAANDAVLSEAAGNAELQGMGTTLVSALLREGSGRLINLGDSRAYLFRQGELHRITHDHSMVADLVRRGEITEAEAETHPRRNVLTRAVGIEGKPQPDLFPLELNEGDVLLLCSDGLHGMVDDVSINAILGAEWSLEARCDALIDAALDAGGKDNITVLIAQRGGNASYESGPPTDPGHTDDTDRDEEEEEWKPEPRPKGEGDGWVYLMVVVVIGLLVWWLWGSDFFGSDSKPVPDTLDIDTTGLLLDSSLQLTPSDMVNDSVWSDSLSTPGGDTLVRDGPGRGAR